MGIFTRYVMLEVLQVFGAALVAITSMLTLVMGVREGLGAGLPPSLIVHVMPYLLPEILGITLPVAMLLAVTLVYGRMSGSQEITALKAAGINPMVVVWPTIVLAFFLSLVCVGTYDLAATWGRPGVRRVVVESVEEIAYGMLRTHRAFKSSQLSIAVKAVRDRKLLRPTITIHARNNAPAVTFTAEEAEIRADRQAGTLILTCRKGQIDVEGRLRMDFPDTVRQVIPFEKPTRPIHRDWLSMGEIPHYLEVLEADRVRLQRRLDDPATPPHSTDRRRWSEQLREVRHNILRLRTEPYRRWANGFTILSFAVLGMPVAMWRRSGSFLTTFFVCFLPILAFYYPLLMLGEDLSTSGTLHPISFWLGNGLVLVCGLVLLRLYCRY